MPTPLPPGIGDTTQAAQATAFIREQPWYLQWVQGLGKDPNGQLNLNNQQQEQLAALAQQHGIGMNSRYDEIGPNGDIVEGHHKLKKSLIAAGIGGLALTGFGAAGIGPLSGALGGSAAAGAGGAAAAGIPTTAGISSATALGLPVTAGLGSAGAAGAGAAAAGGLASTQIGTGAIGPITGGSGLAGGGSTGIGSTLIGAAKSYASDPTNWLDIAKQTGDLMSANAAGAAQGRVTQAGVNQNQDRNAISLYQALLNNNSAQNNFGINRGTLANSNANTDLEQRKYALTAPQTRATTAVRGDILANAQDATVSGVSPNIPVPTISGGLRPSMFSADTRALGGIMSSQARQQQEKGDTFSPLPALPDWQAPPAAPTLTPPPNATGMDNALSNTGNILNYAGSFADLLKKYQGGKKPAGTSSTMTNDQALSSGTGQWA